MTLGIDTRRLALDVLLEVECAGAFADASLGRGLASRSAWSASDRGLVTWLVYGVLVWQRRLDWISDRWVRPQSARLDPEVRACLRLGLLQLFFSDRIPPFAAVDTAVELAKSRLPAAARLVNAVLRRATREGQPRIPDGARAEDLGLRWSHPDWMVRRWIDELGVEETERLLEANNRSSPLCVRAPRSDEARRHAAERLDALGIVARPGTYDPDAWILEGGFPTKPIAALVPQGEASQLVARLVEDHSQGAVLDACAAPGGKASALAEAAGSNGRLVATDVHRGGLVRARNLSTEAGHRPPLVVQADARTPPFPPGSFDAVLVDAPCSGVGTLRSHPEIRWRLRTNDVSDLAARQKAILTAVAPLVRPGGALVYATCSAFLAENDAVVDRFLKSAEGWRKVDPTPHLPPSAGSLVDGCALRTAPHRHDLDGFFAVRMERSSS